MFWSIDKSSAGTSLFSLMPQDVGWPLVSLHTMQDARVPATEQCREGVLQDLFIWEETCSNEVFGSKTAHVASKKKQKKKLYSAEGVLLQG